MGWAPSFRHSWELWDGSNGGFYTSGVPKATRTGRSTRIPTEMQHPLLGGDRCLCGEGQAWREPATSWESEGPREGSQTAGSLRRRKLAAFGLRKGVLGLTTFRVKVSELGPFKC